MRCTVMAFTCPCGEQTPSVKSIGLLRGQRIVFMWKCAKCGHTCMFFMDIDNLKNDCPLDLTFTDEDAAWLHAMKVSIPAESPPAE